MLDKKDQIIIEYLMNDCRITTTKLAKYINLSRTATIYRIQQLEKKEFIHRYDTLPNYNKFEIKMGFITVYVPTNFSEKFEKEIEKNLGVISLLKTIHKKNYLITTIANKTEEKKLLSYLNKNKFEYTFNKIQNHQQPQISIFGHPIKYKKPKISPKILNLDEKDIKIIETIFHGGGKYSILKISQKTSISFDQTLYKYKRLKQAGYFLINLAQINLEKFHLNLMVIEFKTKQISHQNFIKITDKTKKTLFSFQINENHYAQTIIVKDIIDFNQTMEKIYSNGENIIENVEIYPIKNWLFLNRIKNLKKILKTKSKK